MNEDDANMLRQHANSADIIELLAKDPTRLRKKRRLRIASILLALLVFVITLFLASNSNVSNEEIISGSPHRYGSSLSQLLGVSFLGLCMILFSSKRLTSFTGFNPLFSLIPIDKPTPLFLFHFVGWILLLLVAGIFLLG